MSQQGKMSSALSGCDFIGKEVRKKTMTDAAGRKIESIHGKHEFVILIGNGHERTELTVAKL